MHHFLDPADCSLDTLLALLDRAQRFKSHPADWPRFQNASLATLFWEPSTRTRLSFERAAQRLCMPVVNLDVSHSSETKGESLEDTVRTLAAMGIDILVVRHREAGVPAALARVVPAHTHLINAGDGTHAHPSQAMLDFMTICEEKPVFSALKIAIVGNIRHSRVAHSFMQAASILGVGELVLVAPHVWQPTSPVCGRVTDSLMDGLQDADVVIALRVQRERLQAHEHLHLEAYRRDYAITEAHLRAAKSDVIVLHPGPVNRGVEIDDEVADGPRSRILTQVSNGVFMRMAIIDALLSH